MQAHGASSAGGLFWTLAALVVVSVGLTLRSGSFFLKGGEPIQRTAHPRLYWASTLVLVLIAAAFAGAGLWIDLRSFPYLPQH
jgi:hypothetical protein